MTEQFFTRRESMKTFTYGGKSDSLIFVEDGFTFPSMSKQVQYGTTSHASYRQRKRSILEPFTLSIPIMAFRKGVDRQALNERLSTLLYSEEPKILKFEDTNWYLIGECHGLYGIS